MNILELYNSLLNHILDVMISNFDMFRLVMEYRVLCHLNTTMIIIKDIGNIYLCIK